MTNATAQKVTPLIMRQHLKVVEVEDGNGYGRFWTGVMPEREVRAEIARIQKRGDFISDVDCSTSCWCANQ